YLSRHNLKLSEFVAENDVYKHIEETNFEIEDKQGVMEAIAEEFSHASVDWLDGVTVTLEDSWFNVRASNTEPVIRLNAEAKTEEQLDKIVKDAKAVIEKFQ